MKPVLYPQFEGLNLNEQQQNFVVIYCSPEMGFNATRSYLRAYDLDPEKDYNTAGAAASALLKIHKIQDAIRIQMDKLISDHETMAKAVLNSWSTTAFSDPFNTLDVSGPFVNLKNPEEIPQHIRANIQSIENGPNGIKVVMCDKNKARENIARALGMFTEDNKQVGEGYESLIARLSREENEGKK